MAELGEVTAQGIDHLRALPDKTLMCPIGHRAGLVLGALDGHEVHVGPQRGLCNRRRIGSVVFLSLDERLDVDWWDQPNLVSEILSEAPPEVAGRARFHRHDARCLRLQKLLQLRAGNGPII